MKIEYVVEFFNMLSDEDKEKAAILMNYKPRKKKSRKRNFEDRDIERYLLQTVFKTTKHR